MIKVLIVDDEPLAQELLETYLLKMPGFQIIGKCGNALEAFALLNREHTDLMLLDINMPEINGIDFLKTLKNPPKVIFTTAYSQYAVESYDLNAVDYLLKPITFERFIKAIHKVIPGSQESNIERSVKPAATDPDIMFVKSDGKMIKTDLAQVWFVEGLKNYVRIWTESGKIIVHSTMKNLEEQLSGMPVFVRVSKSFIINMRYVSEIDGNSVRIKGELITIGSTYREAVHKLFDSYKLI